MNPDIERLSATIQALEAQRAMLGDAVVDTAVTTLRAQLTGATRSSPSDQDLELKQVTVLFLDVVGSTKLSQRLDPEALGDLLDSFLDRCTAIVDEHSGKVLQYAGDSILAVFGAGRASEDDAERAVRAGLALRDLGPAFRPRVAIRYGHEGFDVRVGVHTGHALLDPDEKSIRGATVHIAARMEQAAAPGSLLISHDTYRHVRGVFDVEPQSPISVKGWDEPLATYVVVRSKPRAFRISSRGIEGLETRMIGREPELEQLKESFLRIGRPGASLVCVSVVAEAGTGKSRLLYEFENWAEARPEAYFVFRGRATPQTRTQPFGLLRDILAWRLQILDGDSMTVAKEKFEAGVAPLFANDQGADDAQAHAQVLGQLIGLEFTDSRHVAGIKEDTRQIRNRGFHVAAQVFRRMSSQNAVPVVLLLDDLHWADDGSLAFLSHLAEVNSDVPMLILALTRPTLFDRESAPAIAWLETAHRIGLGPLDGGASRDLADELLKKLPDVPPVLRELITVRAEGNPFYMEELVKMLIDSGAIRVSAERWSLDASKLLAIKIPPTLAGILQARADGLPAAERRALQQCSVIGITFWDQALACIDGESPRHLASLTRRELIVSRDGATAPTGGDAREYAFGHQILHQVIYETVLKRQRVEAHAKVAQWFAHATGARANDFLGTAAEHFEQAGELANACEYFARAAEHASRTFSHEVMLDYTERALALARSGDAAMRWRLLANRERTLDLQGRRVEQLADVEALIELAETLDDDGLRGEAAYRRGDLAARMGDYPLAERESRRAQAMANRAGADELSMRALFKVAATLANLGRPAEGKSLAEQGIARARAMGLPKLEALFANCLGICADLQGDMSQALTNALHCLSLVRRIADSRMETVVVGNVGLWYLKFGAYGQSREYLEEGLRRSRALGIRETQGHILCSLSEVALCEGDAGLALAHAREAFDISVEVGSRQNQTSALYVLGNAELALARWTEAAATFERMENVGSEIGFLAAIFEALEGTARLALARGDPGGAVRAAEQVLARSHVDAARAGDAFGGAAEHRIRLTIYQAWARSGDPRAGGALEEAHRCLHERANSITDAVLRQRYLTQIHSHREIEATWKASRY